MFRIFYPESDATVYEGLETTNTGLDEILEIGKRLGTDGETLQKSRALVKFDKTEITDTLSKYSINVNSCKFVLQLYTSYAKNLPAQYTLESKIVAQPWTNGTGFLNSNPVISNGITWATPFASWSLDSQTGALWISSSQQIDLGTSGIRVSGSGAGGSWLYSTGSTSFSSSYEYSYQTTDLTLDVSDLVLKLISGSNSQSIDNNGFILKFSDADEADPNVTGYINFFSRETHTIYVPKLTMYWDDSSYTSGSLVAADLDSYTVYTKLKPEYKDTEIVRMRIYTRDKYPQKSPTNLFPIQTVKRLPATTYYAIRDAATDEYIIPYDNIYTKVSCDSTSNFIYVDMNGLMPERYYRLEFKIVDGFTEQYIDDEIYFKVVR
jgi:hypothetical protein